VVRDFVHQPKPPSKLLHQITLLCKSHLSVHVA